MRELTDRWCREKCWEVGDKLAIEHENLIFEDTAAMESHG